MMGIRPQLAQFAAAMEATLKLNDHKGGWEKEDINWLLERLFDEYEELETAASGNHRTFTKAEAALIVKEATDVANFAMMIADNAVKKAM